MTEINNTKKGLVDRIKESLGSRKIEKLLIGLGATIVLLFVFQAGVFIGYRKASFSFRFGDNFHKTFGDDRGGFRGSMMDNFMNPHGATGKVIKIALPDFVVEERNNTEKVVTIKDTTLLRRFREELTEKELSVGDTVIVIGDPNNQGKIEAKLIRLISDNNFPVSTTTSKITK